MANLLHVQIKLAVEALVTHIVGVGELSVATELPWDGAAIKVRSVTRRGGWTRGDGGELTESSGHRAEVEVTPGQGYTRAVGALPNDAVWPRGGS